MPTVDSTRRRHEVKPKRAENKANGRKLPSSRNLLTWHDLPEWQKDNEYILTGYRHAQNSWSGCFKSVFVYLHNETVNIHSHLWGAVLFASVLLTFPSIATLPGLPAPTWTDTFFVSIFLLSAIFCLSGSALFHTSQCHSAEVWIFLNVRECHEFAKIDPTIQVAARCHALDYGGILVLIVGSFYPCLYYGFFCEPHLTLLYLSFITVSGLGAAYIVLNPEYAKPTHRGARTAVFIGLGLAGIIPISHAVYIHGMDKLLNQLGVNWLLISGALYIGGALLYANRIPERFSPGKFDYFFSSHQLFHFCVVLAALAHYHSLQVGMQYRHLDGKCVN